MPTAKRKKRSTKSKYRSGAEKTFADMLTKCRIKFEYEKEKISYVIEKKYTPDFSPDKYPFHLEVKGYFRATDRQKHLAIKDQQPDVDVRFVFVRPENKIHPKSTTTYADWCDRHGFLWCKLSDGLPKEWLKK